MKRNLIITLAVILLAGTGYYFWTHRYDYFFQGDNFFEAQNDVDEKSDEAEDDDELDDESAENEDEDEESAQLYDAPIIIPAHCDNKCADFSGENEKKYCEEICGLTEGRRETAENGCGELKGLKRDACFKQKAIDEKNQSYCEEISDEALRENCKNRVLEEIMDQNPAL